MGGPLRYTDGAFGDMGTFTSSQMSNSQYQGSYEDQQMAYKRLLSEAMRSMNTRATPATPAGPDVRLLLLEDE